MRRMLIDDDEAIGGLRNDIGAMELRPCGAERERGRLFRARLIIGASGLSVPGSGA